MASLIVPSQNKKAIECYLLKINETNRFLSIKMPLREPVLLASMRALLNPSTAIRNNTKGEKVTLLQSSPLSEKIEAEPF